MAAGQGFKTFVTGEVLTASDTNGYLMQGVNVFANAAARTAAITSPQEGQMSFLKDTDSTEYYNGSAWTAVAGASGGLTLLSTTTLSGATTTVSGISGSYIDLQVVVIGVTNATGDGEFRVAINSSTGSIMSGTMGYKHGVGTFTVNGTSSGYLTLTNSTPDRANAQNAYRFTIYRYATADANKMIAHNATWIDTDPMFFLGTSDFYSTSAVTSLQFSNTGGNLLGGTVYVYGVK